MKEGLNACYDVLGGDGNKMQLMNDPAYTSARRIAPLFSMLRLAQGKKGGDDESDNESDNESSF